MSVLEILLLKTKPHLSHSDPALLSALCKARAELKSRVIDTQSCFYQSVSDPSLIFLFGIWPSLGRHNEFLASPQKGAILDSQEELFAFQWALHIPIGVMAELPLNAPVVCLEAFTVKEGAGERFRGECGTIIEEVARPFPVFGGRRVEEEGRWDFLVISGSEGEGGYEDFAAMRESSEEWAVYQLRDMEKKA